jgi:cell division protein FtsI/penicillin-binding protein 2
MYTAPESRPLGRIISARTAEQVTRMMENTVAEGTSRKAFHDPRGKSFFPQLPIAGKTGTLTDEKAGRFYTWFSGFAPSRPIANVEPVAIAVLAVNGANWKVKANTVAREVLRAYFAGQDVPGVTAPTAGKAKATKNVAAATTKKKH